VTEASIYDMDHAPQLPSSSLASQSSAWSGMHQTSAATRRESLSPRPLPQRNRRSLSSMSMGDSIRSSLHIKSDSTSSSRRHLYGMQSSPTLGSSAAPTYQNSSPRRKRAQSTPATGDPFSNVADHPIPNAQSFPPPRRASAIDSLVCRVSFAGDRMMQRDPLSRRRQDNDTDLTNMNEEEVERGESTDMDLAADSSHEPCADRRVRTESLNDPAFPREDWIDFDEDGEAVDSESVATASPQPMMFLGWELPMWCAKRRISWNRKWKRIIVLHCKIEQPLRTSTLQFASLNCTPIWQASLPLSWRRLPVFCSCD
jgi:hypothetical protein